MEKDRRRPGSGSYAKDLGLILGVVNGFLKTPSRMKLPPVNLEAQETPCNSLPEGCSLTSRGSSRGLQRHKHMHILLIITIHFELIEEKKD